MNDVAEEFRFVSDPVLKTDHSADAVRTVAALASSTNVAVPPAVVDGGLHLFVLLRRWQDYLEVCGRVNENTRRQYVRYILQFLAGTLIDLRDVTEDDVVSYLATLPGNGNARGMILRALRSFFAWAADREEIVPNPVRRLKVPRKKYAEAPFLEADELELILEASESIDPRARPTIELMYTTGARIGSIVEVMPDDVDLRRDRITFRVAKNDQPYSVPLGARARAAAEKLLALADYTPRTVKTRRPTLIGVGAGTVWRWVHDAGERAGVRAWSHLLRHTFAERVANDPAIPDLVWAELMNHRDTSLIRRYARGRDELKRQAVASL